MENRECVVVLAAVLIAFVAGSRSYTAWLRRNVVGGQVRMAGASPAAAMLWGAIACGLVTGVFCAVLNLSGLAALLALAAFPWGVAHARRAL
jgi:hypothetical protein